MKRINEAIAEKYSSFTKGQVLLASFISEHCDKAAFMTSFELAAVTGVSQSSVMRFALALGYEGYQDFQQAMQNELKYRLTALEKFELMSDGAEDEDILSKIAHTDALNIKKTSAMNDIEVLKSLCTRLMMCSKVFIYGQGYAAAAAIYAGSYLRVLLQNVCCINMTGLDPLTSAADMDSGDMLICISFPLHSDTTKNLLAYAKYKDACIVTISENTNSETASFADLSLAAESGDYGINGSMAPVISLLSSIICMLAKSDPGAKKKLRDAGDAAQFKGGDR